MIRLSNLKKGAFFRFEGKKTVYIYQGKSKKYGFSYYKFDDVNAEFLTKTDRCVETDFEF